MSSDPTIQITWIMWLHVVPLLEPSILRLVYYRWIDHVKANDPIFTFKPKITLNIVSEL